MLQPLSNTRVHAESRAQIASQVASDVDLAFELSSEVEVRRHVPGRYIVILQAEPAIEVATPHMVEFETNPDRRVCGLPKQFSDTPANMRSK